MIKYLITIFIISVFSINSFSQSGIEPLKISDSKVALINIKDNNNSLRINVKKQPDFVFSTNLYFWAQSVGGTVALPVDRPSLGITQTPELSIDLKFTDALSNLKFAIMLAGKIKYKSIALLYDFYYAELEFEGTVPAGSHYLSGNLTAKQFLGDFAVLYQLPLNSKQMVLSGFAGTRIFSFDNTLDLVNPDSADYWTNKTRTWVDPVIGADAKVDISKHWMVYMKGDIGGFGIASKFTGSLLWTIGYKFSENWNSTAGFKYIYTDYERDNFLWKMSQYGLLLSVGYIIF